MGRERIYEEEEEEEEEEDQGGGEGRMGEAEGGPRRRERGRDTKERRNIYITINCKRSRMGKSKEKKAKSKEKKAKSKEKKAKSKEKKAKRKQFKKTL